jgi:hypothetical protein
LVIIGSCHNQCEYSESNSIGTTTNDAIILGNPLYTEVDKTTNQKSVVVNGTAHMTEVTFSGHGTAKSVLVQQPKNIVLVVVAAQLQTVLEVVQPRLHALTTMLGLRIAITTMAIYTQP